MYKVKLYFSRLLEEMRQMWLPVVGIVVSTLGVICSGVIAENFHLVDLLIQLTMAATWTIAVYSIGILIRREQERKSWKEYLYLILGALVLGIYGAIEYYLMYQYAGFSIAF